MSCLKRLPQSGVGSSPPRTPPSGVQATPSPYRLGAGGQTLRTWHHCSVACPILVSCDMNQLRSQDPQATPVQASSTRTQKSRLCHLPPPSSEPSRKRGRPVTSPSGHWMVGPWFTMEQKQAALVELADAAAACVLINPLLSTSLPFPTVSPFAQAACRISPFLHPLSSSECSGSFLSSWFGPLVEVCKGLWLPRMTL